VINIFPPFYASTFLGVVDFLDLGFGDSESLDCFLVPIRAECLVFAIFFVLNETPWRSFTKGPWSSSKNL
jgi:hypothetical protein